MAAACAGQAERQQGQDAAGVGPERTAASAGGLLPPAPAPPTCLGEQCAWPARGDCRYTAFYCEENVFWLAARLQTLLPSAPLAVVFVSNATKTVPLWRQRAGGGEAVVWDYHVFLAAQPSSGQSALVFDLDTTLPFPCLLSEYRRHALLGGASLPATYRRQYRVVPAPHFLRRFASDRSHMRDARGGWQKPPPPYPCIRAAADGATNTLPAYLEFPGPAPADAAQQLEGRGHAERRQHQAGQHGEVADLVPPGGAAVGPPRPNWAQLQQGAEQQGLGAVLDEAAFLALFGGL